MLRRVTRTGALAARLAKFSRVARADIVPLSVEWHLGSKLFEFFLSAAKLTKLDVEEAGTSEARGMMTTVWRPRVRIPVPEVDDKVEVGVEVTEEELLTVKSAKRKRGPYTKVPCPHGVKYRSNCKVCSACPHGRRRSQCKECGGASFCEHGRLRSRCKECGGGGICEHGRERSKCKECGGASICEHGRRRHRCKECGGASLCEHGRQRSMCKECGGSQICEHGRQRSTCKECRASKAGTNS
jgi:hypothetical protein